MTSSFFFFLQILQLRYDLQLVGIIVLALHFSFTLKSLRLLASLYQINMLSNIWGMRFKGLLPLGSCNFYNIVD